MIVSPYYSVQSSPHAKAYIQKCLPPRITRQTTVGSMFVLNFRESLQRSQIGRAEGFQKVQESILRYLVTTGQMRIGAEAKLKPIPRMVIGTTSALSYQQASASE